MDELDCILCGSKPQTEKQSLHILPPADLVRAKWISFIRLHMQNDDWKPGNIVVAVCSNHFEQSDFAVGYCNKILKTDASPSVWNSSNNDDDDAQLHQMRCTTPLFFEKLTGSHDSEKFIDASEKMEIEVPVPENNVGHETEVVYVMVENSTDVQMNSMFSVKDVDNFIKSDKKKFLIKIIENYETDISRLEDPKHSLSPTDVKHLALMKRELGALREKLFRWALVAIEECLTISTDTEQQETDFERAEYLIFKSNELMQGDSMKEKDAQIQKLQCDLQLTSELERVSSRECKQAMSKNQALLNMVRLARKSSNGCQESAEALISSMLVQLQQAHQKNKEMLEVLVSMKVGNTHSTIVNQDLSRKNVELFKQLNMCKSKVWKSDQKNLARIQKQEKRFNDDYSRMKARSVYVKNKLLQQILENKELKELLSKRLKISKIITVGPSVSKLAPRTKQRDKTKDAVSTTENFSSDEDGEVVLLDSD